MGFIVSWLAGTPKKWNHIHPRDTWKRETVDSCDRDGLISVSSVFENVAWVS